jgi:hypothetical protein
MTTQFAESSADTPYRSQNAAVSASDGSIGATDTSASHEASAVATGAATSPPSAGRHSNVPRAITPVVLPT